MRRHIRTFGQVAQIAQVALVYHFPEIFFINAIQFTGRAFVYQIKQGGKRATQTYTATAPVANIENTLHLMQSGFFVVVLGVFPVNGMPGRGFQTAFACHSPSLIKNIHLKTASPVLR